MRGQARHHVVEELVHLGGVDSVEQEVLSILEVLEHLKVLENLFLHNKLIRRKIKKGKSFLG